MIIKSLYRPAASGLFMATNGSHNRFVRSLTLLITNAIKIAGLVIVLKEVFVPSFGDPTRAEVLAIAAFMMAGAQLSESLIIAALDRLVGGPEQRSSK